MNLLVTKPTDPEVLMLLRQSLTAVAVALSPLVLSMSAYATQDTYVPPDTADAGSHDTSDGGQAVSDVIIDTCTTDADCSNNDVCVDGYCQYKPECATDDECAPGDECVYSQCYPVGLFCSDQNDCGNYANCELGPSGGIGKCTVDPDSVPAYEPCAEACGAAAPCAALTDAQCQLSCNYAAANGQSAKVDALVACAVGKQCAQIAAECAIAEDSVVFPGVFLPSEAPTPEQAEPVWSEYVEYAELGPEAAPETVPDNAWVPDGGPTPDTTGSTPDAGPDTSSNALELAQDEQESGCAAGGSSPTMPLTLGLCILALFASVRSRKHQFRV